MAKKTKSVILPKIANFIITLNQKSQKKA